jgi:hypothetical protein
MILANVATPRATLSWLAPIAIGAGLLAGCQSAGHTPPPEVRADTWRVVERIGEARYLTPGGSNWAAALPATALPAGSQVATGTGGRLILARAADHVSAGPGSEFSLPEPASGAALEQTAGRLRYRLAEPRSLAVSTPALAIGVGGSVFEVSVGVDGTEVAVERGRLRVATPDRQREIELEAGQSAHAGGRETLAYRRGRDQPLEPVERIVLPALQPQPTAAGSAQPEASPTTARPAANQASTSAAASVESAVPIATAGPTSGAIRALAPRSPAAPPAASEAAPTTSDGLAPERRPAITEIESPNRSALAIDPTAYGGAAPGPSADPTAEAPGADRRLLFDLLTEGMIDPLPAQPARRQPVAHARSF